MDRTLSHGLDVFNSGQSCKLARQLTQAGAIKCRFPMSLLEPSVDVASPPSRPSQGGAVQWAPPARDFGFTGEQGHMASSLNLHGSCRAETSRSQATKIALQSPRIATPTAQVRLSEGFTKKRDSPGRLTLSQRSSVVTEPQAQSCYKFVAASQRTKAGG